MKKHLALFVLLFSATFVWAFEAPRTVEVPEAVAALVRPILDAKQKHQDYAKPLLNLTQRHEQVPDEALVVLMCFSVGDSQEEEDAVIARGRHMLKLLRKYQHSVPHIRNREYAPSMLNTEQIKAEKFEGAIKMIQEGRHGTWDNPQG